MSWPISSLHWMLFVWIRTLLLQIVFKIRPLKSWDEENVSGKIVVITGAGSGLGRSVAEAMAKRGAKVVMGKLQN